MLRPLSDHVLIFEIIQERKVEGVLMPDVAREDMKWGKVISVGVKVAELKAGDIVAFGPHAGMRTQFDEVDYLLMKEGEVKGVAEK